VNRATSYVVMTALLAACTTTKTREPSIFAALPGTWGWEKNDKSGCGANPHTISFTRDRSFMLLEHAIPFEGASGNKDPVIRYRLLQAEPYLRAKIEGETRTTPSGEPIVWEVVMLSPDRYCWHRTDWPEGACTAAIERCARAISRE
jgi:hypothetical protein